MLVTTVTCDTSPDVDVVCFSLVNHSPVMHIQSGPKKRTQDLFLL